MRTLFIFLSVTDWLTNNQWVFIILGIIVFAFLAKTFVGWVFIGETENGLVINKWGLGAKSRLQEGRIIATKGEAGIQAKMLEPGLHFWMWWWKYSIEKQEITEISAGEIGVVESIDGAPIPAGAVLVGNVVECNMYQDAVAFLNNGGQKGFQRNVLTVGSYRINRKLFDVDREPMRVVPANKIGLVNVLDGISLKEGMIAGPIIEADHKYFQDANVFLNGGGYRGMQEQVLRPGNYYINPRFAEIEEEKMTEISIGYVGVVNSYIGEDGADISGDDFKHGNIVEKGKKGIWNWTYDPGMYPVNTRLMKVVPVPTTNIVLNWAEGSDKTYGFDENLKTIQVKSKDGFEFEVDVAQIINISDKSAPKVIARFGSIQNLVSQVLEPTIGNYFRNSAQTSEALEFVYARKTVEESAKGHITEILKKYDIECVDTLLGDVKPPEQLMSILKEQMVAEKSQEMFNKQKLAEEKRQDFVKAKTAADKEEQLTGSKYDKEIATQNAAEQVERAKGEKESKIILADGHAYEFKTVGKAEGESILAIGSAEAEVIQKKTDAMGQDKFAQVEVAKALAGGGIAIVPKVAVYGGGEKGSNAGILDALIGAELLKKGILNDESKTKVEKTETKIEKDSKKGKVNLEKKEKTESEKSSEKEEGKKE
jgi:uncharacterized membrane protein YqiK